MENVAWLLGLTLMIVGLIGVFIPVMPGIPIMWLGALLYSWLTGFDILTWPWLLLLTLLTVASFAVDFAASAWIARKMGSSRWGAAGVILGTIIGIVFFGAFGALLGGVGGAVLVEASVRRSLKLALRAGTGAFLGFVFALVADTAVGAAMLAIYLWVTA